MNCLLRKPLLIVYNLYSDVTELTNLVLLSNSLKRHFLTVSAYLIVARRTIHGNGTDFMQIDINIVF